MPHRTYTDPQGRLWDVWSVQPEYAERRRTPVHGTTLPPAQERREKKGFRVPLGRAWAGGWLVFETKGEKRRLAPFPPNWTELTDAELDELRGSATITQRPTRRLIE
ncbi:MAG TPA: hypothetical protein VN706_16680 [Gemmatimonadaceae bacterium]|nr:hypothetical protein [Gemmatimonadaceae bacterium]